uniref:RING-type domain-containing protein n=1 Tax=Ditylenchus dipsaci TaxID=166011 RepID=A0A915EK23_9BILA
MGNCLPFFQNFVSDGGHDDLTRLDNLPASSSNSSRSSSTSRRSRSSSENSGGAGSRRHHHRNLHPSSYVNELYVNSTLGGGMVDEEGAEHRAMDEKRKARVRGLLEQLPVDVYVEGGKGDDECAICMVDFAPKEPIRFLPCMHAYHVKCIDDWLLRSFTCPFYFLQPCHHWLYF